MSEFDQKVTAALERRAERAQIPSGSWEGDDDVYAGARSAGTPPRRRLLAVAAAVLVLAVGALAAAQIADDDTDRTELGGSGDVDEQQPGVDQWLIPAGQPADEESAIAEGGPDSDTPGANPAPEEMAVSDVPGLAEALALLGEGTTATGVHRDGSISTTYVDLSLRPFGGSLVIQQLDAPATALADSAMFESDYTRTEDGLEVIVLEAGYDAVNVQAVDADGFSVIINLFGPKGEVERHFGSLVDLGASVLRALGPS